MITDISQLDPKGIYTYADYLKWQFDESVELIQGKLYWMSPAPKRMHQSASIRLENLIFNYLDGKRCEVYVAPFDVRLPVQNKKKPNQIHTVVQPDISVICDPAKLDDDVSSAHPTGLSKLRRPERLKKISTRSFTSMNNPEFGSTGLCSRRKKLSTSIRSSMMNTPW